MFGTPDWFARLPSFLPLTLAVRSGGALIISGRDAAEANLPVTNEIKLAEQVVVPFHAAAADSRCSGVTLCCCSGAAAADN